MSEFFNSPFIFVSIFSNLNYICLSCRMIFSVSAHLDSVIDVNGKCGKNHQRWYQNEQRDRLFDCLLRKKIEEEGIDKEADDGNIEEVACRHLFLFVFLQQGIVLLFVFEVEDIHHNLIDAISGKEELEEDKDGRDEIEP